MLRNTQRRKTEPNLRRVRCGTRRAGNACYLVVADTGGAPVHDQRPARPSTWVNFPLTPVAVIVPSKVPSVVPSRFLTVPVICEPFTFQSVSAH